MTTARNAGRINVWPSTVIARAADTAESKVLGRMTIWPTHGGALENREYPADVEEGGYVGPLDIVPGAVLAHSQRAMSAAKRGTALYTLREDAGDTTQSFNSDAVTGVPPVAAMTTFLDGANGFVTLSNDQSASAKDQSQSDSLYQFGWSPSGPNSIPEFTSRSDIDDNYYGSLSPASGIALVGGAYTAFAVVKVVSAGGGSILRYRNGGTGEELSFNASGTSGSSLRVSTLAVSENTNQAAETSDVVSGYADAFHIFEAAWTFGSCSIRIDGTAISFTPDDVGGVPQTISLPLAIGGDNQFLGSVVEVLLYPSVLSDANRLAIRQNIADAFGITLA